MPSLGCCVLCGDTKFSVGGTALEWCHNKESRACLIQTGDQGASQSSLWGAQLLLLA